jgi:hypothetical protein
MASSRAVAVNSPAQVPNSCSGFICIGGGHILAGAAPKKTIPPSSLLAPANPGS